MQKKHVKGLKLVKARNTRSIFNELLSVVDVIICAKKYRAKPRVKYIIFFSRDYLVLDMLELKYTKQTKIQGYLTFRILSGVGSL